MERISKHWKNWPINDNNIEDLSNMRREQENLLQFVPISLLPEFRLSFCGEDFRNMVMMLSLLFGDTVISCHSFCLSPILAFS